MNTNSNTSRNYVVVNKILDKVNMHLKKNINFDFEYSRTDIVQRISQLVCLLITSKVSAQSIKKSINGGKTFFEFLPKSLKCNQDIENKYAIMGIIIGDQSWWGKGVAVEVIIASAKFLSEEYHIEEIILGVKESNISAIKAYKKIGFEFCSSKYIEQESNSSLTMTLKTKSLY